LRDAYVARLEGLRAKREAGRSTTPEWFEYAVEQLVPWFDLALVSAPGSRA
jgi:hypothetical protein